MTSPRFRAVIIGGGPVGLCLAHALSLAGIDYILLERRDTVVEPSGFGLALWPHGVRVLDQLGLLEEGREIGLLMKDKYNLGPDGREIARNDLYEEIERNHGHPWLLFKRQELLDLLHNRLPENSARIRTQKKVVAIETHADGVKVRCDDGSVEEGSIAIGCDGVYSRVRGIMRDLAFKSSGKVLGGETPMISQYQLLAGYLHRIPHMEPGRLWEIRDNGMSIQVFMLEREGWFLAYRRLPQPTRQHTRYTDEDALAFAEEIMDHPVGNEMKFRDLWQFRRWIRLVNLEEGSVKHWHWDRIVLVGDSVHKMTPNAGLGVNQGWQGVVALTNALRHLVMENSNPDTAALTRVFKTYQAKTDKMARDSMWLSKLYTRITSWHNFAYKMADHVGPYMGGDLTIFKLLASPIVKRGIVLDFVPEKGHKIGRIKWDIKPPEKVEEDTGSE